jgi:hypothetical protein
MSREGVQFDKWLNGIFEPVSLIFIALRGEYPILQFIAQTLYIANIHIHIASDSRCQRVITKHMRITSRRRSPPKP